LRGCCTFARRSAVGRETHHEGSKEGKADEEEGSFDGINRIDRMGGAAREQVNRGAGEQGKE